VAIPIARKEEEESLDHPLSVSIIPRLIESHDHAQFAYMCQDIFITPGNTIDILISRTIDIIAASCLEITHGPVQHSPCFFLCLLVG
jgi:hypothetical protein